MKKLALVLFLSLASLSSSFAYNGIHKSTSAKTAISSASDDQISDFIWTKFQERTIEIRTIDGVEDVYVLTETGKVIYVSIENGIIINGEEDPIN